MTFLSHLINGISLGSVYAIIALGYTMVYGIAKMLNFAHGDVIMVGAYISFCTTSYLGLSPLVSVLFFHHRLHGSRHRCRTSGIQAPASGSFPRSFDHCHRRFYFLQNAALLIWGSSPKTFSSVTGSWTLKLFDGQLIISGVTIVTILACILIMICLTLFTNKTKMGTAMRAVSEDKAAAGLMGINVNTTISLTFAIGSGLAAIAGVLLCSAYPTLMPTTGSMPGIKAFTAAVFGGIGSIPGAMIGGILLGIIEIFSKAYISTQLSDAIVFAVLIVNPDRKAGWSAGQTRQRESMR